MFAMVSASAGVGRARVKESHDDSGGSSSSY